MSCLLNASRCFQRNLTVFVRHTRPLYGSSALIGVTPESSSGITLLRSLCEEIGQQYGVTEEIPVEFHSVVRTFADRLELATADRPLVLFIDALDQIAASDREGLRASLGNRGDVLARGGDLDGAMAIYLQEERLCRELGNRAGLAAALGHQASIHKRRGFLDGAMSLFRQQEEICRELGDKHELSASLNDQALVCQDRGELRAALALHQQSEQLCREMNTPLTLAGCLGNQGLILKTQGDLDGAMALHREEERICRQASDKDGLQRTLGNQAGIIAARHDPAGAMALLEEKALLCRDLGNVEGLAIALANQALMTCFIPGRQGESQGLAGQAMDLATRHGDQRVVDRVKQVQAVLGIVGSAGA
jgi:tetratricopeptide (TPR) repeat protein